MEKIPQGRYTKEFREEAARLVIEDGMSVGEVSARLSLPKSTLENWVRAAKAGKLGDIGKNRKPVTEVEVELARVKRELAITRMERDILKKSSRVLCEGVAARYAMINSLRLQYPLPPLCYVLDVSASGYHAWSKRPPSRRAQEEARLEVEIKAAHRRTRETYGPERLQEDLAAHGVHVGVHRIKRLRRKLGLRCRQKKRFKVTTDSKHSLPVAENLLAQKFEVSAPSRVWLSDITYISTREGWLYLAGHKDMCTREIVGYAMSARMTKNLVSQSLFRAVAAKRPVHRLIHHSDRGSQYCALEFRKLLVQFGIRASMSGKGNCYDNGVPRTPQGDALREMRVRPLGIGLQDQVPNHVELLGSRALGSEHRRKSVIKDVRCDAGRRTQVNH